nr:carboxymuconolactone decarboxylase family protein [Rhizobium mesoamericanum]
MRELIVFEISVTTRCDVCIAAHSAGALPRLRRRGQMKSCNFSTA